jgi:hypothetical protein
MNATTLYALCSPVVALIFLGAFGSIVSRRNVVAFMQAQARRTSTKSQSLSKPVPPPRPA